VCPAAFYLSVAAAIQRIASNEKGAGEGRERERERDNIITIAFACQFANAFARIVRVFFSFLLPFSPSPSPRSTTARRLIIMLQRGIISSSNSNVMQRCGDAKRRFRGSVARERFLRCSIRSLSSL